MIGTASMPRRFTRSTNGMKMSAARPPGPRSTPRPAPAPRGLRTPHPRGAAPRPLFLVMIWVDGARYVNIPK